MPTARHDLDATSMAALDDVVHHEPLLGVASLLCILGIVVGVFVAAIGCVGVSAALLRMSDAEFDLPALEHASASALAP